MSKFTHTAFALMASIMTAVLACGPAFGAIAVSAGGSMIGYHTLPANYIRPDNLHTWDPPNGTVINYNNPAVQATVNQYLQNLYNNGQRKLGLMLWHKRDALGANTVIKSLGGNFSSQVRSNIVNLLSKAKAMGFTEALVRFGPLGHNYVGYWWDRLQTGQTLPPAHDYDADGIYTHTFSVSPVFPTNCEPL